MSMIILDRHGISASITLSMHIRKHGDEREHEFELNTNVNGDSRLT